MPAYLGSEGVMLNAASEIQNDGTVLEKLIKRTISTYENPYLSEVGNHAFANCSSLISVNLPQVTTIGGNAFRSCSSLTTANLPQVTTIGSSAFGYCTSLAVVSLSQVTLIRSYAFRNCYNLLSLYLLGSSVPTLTSTTAFTSTPILFYTTSTGGVYGSIYVPASLHFNYIGATNWSAFSSRIVSVGD